MVRITGSWIVDRGECMAGWLDAGWLRRSDPAELLLPLLPAEPSSLHLALPLSFCPLVASPSSRWTSFREYCPFVRPSPLPSPTSSYGAGRRPGRPLLLSLTIEVGCLAVADGVGEDEGAVYSRQWVARGGLNGVTASMSTTAYARLGQRGEGETCLGVGEGEEVLFSLCVSLRRRCLCPFWVDYLRERGGG
jgi:hypothetical protein